MIATAFIGTIDSSSLLNNLVGITILIGMLIGLSLWARHRDSPGSYPTEVLEYIKTQHPFYRHDRAIGSKLLGEGARNHERVLQLDKPLTEYQINELYWLAAFDIRLHYFTNQMVRQQEKQSRQRLVDRVGENETRDLEELSYADSMYSSFLGVQSWRHGSNDILIHNITPNMWVWRLEDAEARVKQGQWPLIDTGKHRSAEVRKWATYYDDLYWKYAKLVVTSNWQRLPSPDEVCEAGELYERNKRLS